MNKEESMINVIESLSEALQIANQVIKKLMQEKKTKS
ncbi:Uncharacterised protein [Pediococcus pentosaceus]|nr:Uncharacterised protein [Pediococcus pentosaceus]